MCCLYSIFSSQPNEVGHDFTLHNCDIIQHIFSPTRSVARKTLLWTFLWPSNSKFVIFPELYPCINYRILAFYAPIPVQIHGNSIIPPYHIQGNFEYRGILLYKQHIVQWRRLQSVKENPSNLLSLLLEPNYLSSVAPLYSDTWIIKQIVHCICLIFI